MLLAIDVGNTQTHLGMFRGDELVEHWRFATVRFATADELATVLASMLDLRELSLRDVDAAIVSSVVPTLAQEYELLIERYLAGRGAMVGPGLKTGMADPHRQPAGAGRRPARERRGRLRPRGRRLHRRRLRHGDQLRRGLEPAASTWAA